MSKLLLDSNTLNLGLAHHTLRRTPPPLPSSPRLTTNQREPRRRPPSSAPSSPSPCHRHRQRSEAQAPSTPSSSSHQSQEPQELHAMKKNRQERKRCRGRTKRCGGGPLVWLIRERPCGAQGGLDTESRPGVIERLWAQLRRLVRVELHEAE